MIQMPDNSFLIENGIKPGSQNTALTPEVEKVAKTILEMEDGGKYGSKKLSVALGGCAMNTTRAANYYLLATSQESYSKKVVTVGSIGEDKAGTTV